MDYKTSTKVTGVDASKQTVTTESGETISYEKLIYALGARVSMHKLPCRGNWHNGMAPLSHPEEEALAQGLLI